MELSKLHRDIDPFYSKGYLNCWCADVKKEWTEFLHRVFAQIIEPSFISKGSNDLKNTQLLDIGCGPSIANIISASKYFNRITMADYLTSNRNEVERFVEQNADFEWMHYFQYVSDLEHDPNVEDIIQRTRNSIERVIFCDVTNENVFGNNVNEEFDVIIASLVFDVVATTKEMFKIALKHVVQYLKPGGFIVIQGSIGEHCYTVGSAMFPAMNATEELILDIFKEEHLEVKQMELCQKLTTHYYVILQKLHLPS